ncbi:DMT family transporter [Roseibacterium sp. SDUM158016]|jgi:drug/metabolite transporter (DMT)-like permease|uniref:DMT family transporter n=1 Tax=Roseicyclus sediminis TaxID=2980997 RepID=UPI0021D10E85|nr:DMT family transporter [Roseibacterium sp. SDUM158016]MCU4651267.1 DMT family transporter [Roseibacterium sp. SDUM158016]
MAARPTDRVLPAILISLVAILLFDLMGLVIKYLSSRYGAAELSAWRNLFGIVPGLIALWSTRSWHRAGRPWRMRQWYIPVIRGLAVTVAQFCFYLALGRLAFATATTITYSNALFIVALSAPILGERVGPFRWAAALIGFAGVVMVMGPGRDGFSTDAILPLIAAMLYGVSGVMSRLLDEDVPSALVNLQSAAIAAMGALTLTLATGGFTPIASAADLGWIAAMGAFGGTAVLCLVIAYRMTEPSNLAPFSYFGIPTALLLGWVFFGEAPLDDLWPGALLIIAGGLMIVWRERRLARRPLGD